MRFNIYKKIKYIFDFLIAILIFNFLFLILASEARAMGASLYFSPNAGTFYVGSTFDVSVFTDTGENNINAVRVDLKFDPKKIQIASPTAGKSFISVWVAQPTYSNIEGTATFIGGIPSPGIKTSSGLVSTITFRVIAPGETTVLFSTSSRALLNDGQGTNVLTSLSRGVYRLTIPPPEGPEVYSSTHPDQNEWYKNNNPTFSWVKEEDVSDFSYILDRDSKGVPDNIIEGASTSISYSNLEDGIWYFHIKANKANIWGGTSHYLVQIDSTAPAVFTPKISPSDKTRTLQPIVSFITTDALSGFEHFEIKIIDVTSERAEQDADFFIEAVSPYKLPVLEVGKYLLVVRAFDVAGNWRDETVQLEIVPEGIGVTKGGIWLWGIFLPWWLLLLILLLIIIFVIIILLHNWKKHKKYQLEIKQELQEQEERLKRTIQVKI